MRPAHLAFIMLSALTASPVPPSELAWGEETTGAPQAPSPDETQEPNSSTCLKEALQVLTKSLSWKIPPKAPQLPGTALWRQHLERHPILKGGELDQFMSWYEKDSYHHMDGPVMQIHLSDWFKSLGISAPEEVADLQRVWSKLSGEQRSRAINKLVEAVDNSMLTKVFSGDVSKWGEELKLIKKMGLSPEYLQEFNLQWSRLDPDERHAFFLITVADDLPGALEAFVPLVKQGDQIVHANPVKKVPIKIVTGPFRRKTIQVDQRIASFVASLGSLDERAIANTGVSIATETQSVSFDELEYFATHFPKEKMKEWGTTGHTFRSVTEDDAKAHASEFATHNKQNGFTYGRMSTYCNIVTRFIDHLETAPTETQYAQLLKWITNGREQNEIIHRLKERFPNSMF